MGMISFDSILNNKFSISWILKELIYGAHITSLAATCIILSILIILDLPIDIFALFAAYLMTYIVYTYNYQSEINDDLKSDPDKYAYLKKRKVIYPYILGFSLLLLLLLLLYINDIRYIIFMLILLSGGILYTVIFKVLTEYIPGFKSIYVSIMLTYFVIFYSLFLYSVNINNVIILLTIILFIKLFINIVFFDIKDMDVDNGKLLKTFPVIIGKRTTILVLMALNIISLILIILGIYYNILPLYTIILIAFFFYTLFYLYRGLNATKTDLLYYTYVMADAEYILWPILLYIAKYILQNNI